MNIFFRSSRHP